MTFLAENPPRGCDIARFRRRPRATQSTPVWIGRAVRVVWPDYRSPLYRVTVS
jgi:hypothetical protein